MKLHWLKVEERIEFKVKYNFYFERIEFKILLITYKAICGMVPDYISELVTYSPLSGSRTPWLLCGSIWFFSHLPHPPIV